MKKVFGVLILAAVIAGAVAVHTTARTFMELLTENKELRQSLARLADESQIGYAKVTDQSERDGRLFTTLLFVETAHDNPQQRTRERVYEIEGDIVHFDALIVKFDSAHVQDGRERALYLWRRVYGEHMKPADGYPIETPGETPQRYRDLTARLHLRDRTTFWNQIWELANDPDRLKHQGIQAIDGHAVYKKLRPGLIYVFKGGAMGQLAVEAVPAL